LYGTPYNDTQRDVRVPSPSRRVASVLMVKIACRTAKLHFS
jgi:hypothetical protein